MDLAVFLPENKVQTIGELHDQWLSDTERRMMPLLQAQAGRCGFLAEGVWKLSGALISSNQCSSDLIRLICVSFQSTSWDDAGHPDGHSEIPGTSPGAHWCGSPKRKTFAEMAMTMPLRWIYDPNQGAQFGARRLFIVWQNG